MYDSNFRRLLSGDWESSVAWLLGIRTYIRTTGRPFITLHPAQIMHPSRYRTRLILDLCRTFILPSAVLVFAVQITGKGLGLFTIPLHVFFAIVCAIARDIYSNTVQLKEAKQLGAKPIPRIIGKWPGNIDILLRMMRAFRTSYVLDVYLQLFEEYQCTTLNTRILWVDNVCIIFFSISEPTTLI